MVSPLCTHPVRSGSEGRVARLSEIFLEMGHQVHFLSIPRWGRPSHSMKAAWNGSLTVAKTRRVKRFLLSIARQNFLLKQRCSENPGTMDYWQDNTEDGFNEASDTWVDQWLSPSFYSQLDQIKKNFDPQVVWVEYFFLSKILTFFPDSVLKVIDTHDVFHGRHEKLAVFGVNSSWVSTTAEEESKGLSRADKVVAIQDDERGILQRLTHGEVVTVGDFPDVTKRTEFRKGLKKLLFVSSGNPADTHGLELFLRESWPSIRSAHPSAELLLAGGICSPEYQHFPGVQLLGKFDDPRQIYSLANICINPVVIGSGLKIKSVEALAQGKALVTTPEGAAGLCGAEGEAFWVADTTEQFSELIGELFESDMLTQRLSSEGLRFALTRRSHSLSQLEEVLSFVPAVNAQENSLEAKWN